MGDKDFQKSIKDFQRINRIVNALASVNNPEDVYGIILCSLISPQGLNFTRCLLFAYDEKLDCFTGKMVLGPSTEKEARGFLGELKREEKALNSIIKNHNLEEAPESEAWDFCLSALKMSSLWIAIAQKLSAPNPLNDTIKRYSFSCQARIRGENFFYEICETNRAQIIFQDGKDSEVPASLVEIMDDPFVALPLRSKNKPYAVVLLDRKFSRKSISAKDIPSLQWFMSQATLAIENATLYQNLQTAYREIRELDVLKSNFLSTVSHELRTPLTTIHGFVELLVENRAGEITKVQKDILIRVAKNAKHLISIVNDIVEVAEINIHGKTELNVEEIDPYPILLNAVARVKERRTEKRISFDIQPEEESCQILGERNSLERILYHILDNAVKFSRENGRVSVTFQRKNGELQIAIADEGVGVAPENLSRIFDFFYQAEGNLNRAFEGLGLGLTITRFLLAATGGKILAESVLNKGSVFIVAYPITRKREIKGE